MLYNLRYFIIFNTNKVMKKLFTLLAVVLLTSASAMAQSGNNNLLKGDVNSDGSVNVADIASVIDLIQKGQGTGEAGYFYLGTTKPTAENFTTLTGAVATYTSIDEAVGTKVSVAAGEKLYMLFPTSWMKTKDVALEDGGGETVNFSKKDAATISGYSIYETSAWKSSSTATLKIIPSYFWYCGPISESGENTIKISDTMYIPTINNNSFIDESEQLSDLPGWRKIDMNSSSNYIYNDRERHGYIIYLDGRDEKNEPTYDNFVPAILALPVACNLILTDGIGSSFDKYYVKTITYNNISYNIYKLDFDEFILTIRKQ